MLSPIKEGESSYSPLQRHFLERLNRLLSLRADQVNQLNEDGLLLIDRTIYSTYCDAVDMGVADEAQRMLHRRKSRRSRQPAAN
ncbi:MAG TPA: hypothetical protein VMR52_00290 [Dehalococcoidia bacterium]|nr:hypothetical protein [Dehalococcoidia bacterium]